MKIFFILTVFFNFSAYAQDRVGDWIKYHGTYNQQQAEVLMKVTEYHDRKYLVLSEYQLGDAAAETHEQWLGLQELSTPESSASIVRFCEFYDGKREEITISGVTYQTCKVRSVVNVPVGDKFVAEKADIWMGEFPVLGFAKIKSENADLEFSDFEWVR
jgi:hypothetical protein